MTGSPMSPRMWDILVRKLAYAQDRGDRAACLILSTLLLRVVASGGPR